MTRNKYSWLLAHISCSKCFWVHEGKSVCWRAASLALLQHPRIKPWFWCAPFLYNSCSHTDFSSSPFGLNALMTSFQALTNLSCASFPAGFVDLFGFHSTPTHHHPQRGGGKGERLNTVHPVQHESGTGMRLVPAHQIQEAIDTLHQTPSYQRARKRVGESGIDERSPQHAIIQFIYNTYII